MKTGTTSKSVTELVQAIVDDGCGVYTNDDGNGCAGPMYCDEHGLRQMLEDEASDEYEIVTETRRGEPAAKIIKETLKAHGHDLNDGTGWILAEKVDDEGSNPYTHYLLLWEV